MMSDNNMCRIGKTILNYTTRIQAIKYKMSKVPQGRGMVKGRDIQITIFCVSDAFRTSVSTQDDQ